MYKEITIFGIANVTQKHIIRNDGDGKYTSFPADDSNPDYQAYLKWLSEGNTPEPAEE